MILYLVTKNSKMVSKIAMGANVLTTYWDMRKLSAVKLEKYINTYKYKRFFLDCGAFSAWNYNEEIDVYDYIQYLHKVKHMLTEYPQLDVLGDLDRTRYNLKVMETAGLNPIPVFHARKAPISYFKELVDRGYKRICIGAIAKTEGVDFESEVTDVFNEIFDYIVDKKTKTVKCRLHVFGYTRESNLIKYPFWSADSTGWLAGAQYGHARFFDEELCKVVVVPLRSKKYIKYVRGFPKDYQYLLNPKAYFNYGRVATLRMLLGRIAYERLGEFVTNVWKEKGYKFL